MFIFIVFYYYLDNIIYYFVNTRFTISSYIELSFLYKPNLYKKNTLSQQYNIIFDLILKYDTRETNY